MFFSLFGLSGQRKTQTWRLQLIGPNQLALSTPLGMPQMSFVMHPNDPFPLHWICHYEDAGFILRMWGDELLAPGFNGKTIINSIN